MYIFSESVVHFGMYSMIGLEKVSTVINLRLDMVQGMVEGSSTGMKLRVLNYVYKYLYM